MTVLLGTLSGMVRVKCPSEATTDEPPEETVVRTAAGAYSMRPPYRPLRKWSLRIGLARPQEEAALRGLLRYSTTPLIFVSEDAAGTNGLTPAQSAFEPSVLPVGVSRGGVEYVTDRYGEFPVTWTASTTVTDAWVLGGPDTPVIPGGPVTIAAGLRLMSGQTPRLGVDWVTSTGTVLSRSLTAVSDVSTTQPLARKHRTLTAPVNAAALRMVFQGVSQVAAPSVTLTDELAEYGEGDGAPEVVPTSSTRDLLSAVTGRMFAGHALTLEEVGLAVR